MNFIKSPQDMLFEEAGMRPASPGPFNTPQQAMLDRTIPQPLMPMFAQPSPADMQAMMIAMGQTPQQFKDGGAAREISPVKRFAKKLMWPAAITGLLAPDIVQAAEEAKEGKYGEAAGTAGLIASGFLPGPLQALLLGLTPGELGKGTLDSLYEERVPGSVLPARINPTDLR